MKRLLLASAIILATALSAQAATKHHKRHTAVTRQSDVTVWNRESSDPNIGWHTVNGDRVCSHDCDNPEIPGSGAVCRNVIVMGMRMHDCVTGN